MILDTNNMFDGRATGTFVAITATRDSTDILDFGISGQTGNGRDMSPGTDLYLLLISNRLFATGTSLTIDFRGAPDNGSGAEGTYVTYASSGAITTANLNAAPGLLFPISLPRPPYGGLAVPRFYKLTYTVGGSNFTAGAVMAGLVLAHNRDDMIYYPGGFVTTNI